MIYYDEFIMCMRNGFLYSNFNINMCYYFKYYKNADDDLDLSPDRGSIPLAYVYAQSPARMSPLCCEKVNQKKSGSADRDSFIDSGRMLGPECSLDSRHRETVRGGGGGG